MTTQLNYIDDYFSGNFSKEEKMIFEEKVQSDPAFAEEVSFYLSSMAVSREDADQEKKKRFKELYVIKNEELSTPVVKFRWLRPAMSAAAVLLVVLLAWTLFLKPPSATQMADRFIREKFTTLGVQMGTSDDQLQKAKSLYNEGKYNEALQILENLLKEKSTDDEVIKLAGIVSLKVENYDKALGYFKWLADLPGLYDNPGRFYQALTLMKRNLPGDKQKAKIFLQEVVDKKLSGSETAQEWLKDL
jgi:hypothetical protein